MPKGNLSKFFPGKLRLMLDTVDDLGLSHGSSWVSEGRAFAIHDPEVFMNEIAPQFFDKQTHLRSFHRQLSIWGFTRLETGAGGRGVWFHKHFIRDQPDLIKHIKRVPVKNPKPTLATPKNQLPDYTNYQLPVSLGDAPNAAAHQPHLNMNLGNAAAGPGSELLPPHLKASLSTGSPQEGLDYLTALGRLPQATAAGAPRGYGAAAQAPMGQVPQMGADQGRRGGYPPFMLNNYHPSAVPSMNHRMPSGFQGANPSSAPAGSDPLGDVAQQLLSCRNNASQSQGSAGDGGNNNLNSAILAMIMDSRNRDTPNSSNNGVSALNNDDLLSAIARRNLFQGPKTS